LGTIEGEVTLDNQPLKEGNIQFIPVSLEVPTGGSTIKDGKFTATVPAAEMRVLITANKVIGQRRVYDSPDSPVVPDVVELIPARYNSQSELTYHVKEGSQTTRFDLQSN
jgi:hypothetical protein